VLPRIEQATAARIIPDDMIAALIESTDADEIVAALIKSIPPVDLLRYVPMSEAERLSSLSVDGLERHFPHWIKELSPRRKGMRVIHALMVRHQKKQPLPPSAQSRAPKRKAGRF
jgi:hypothetical protein